MNPQVRIDSGDTAWMLVSTALVLLMTPGLAFFYGGMVQSRHVVSTLLQNLVSVGVVGILWAFLGYSLVFSGDHMWLGDLGFSFLRGVGQEPNAAYAPNLPHQVFMLFQCMFAVITPALMTGAVAERIRFKAWVAITALWSLVIYVPIAHWVWGTGGWIRSMGALDFAGGMVVHMAAGFSALTAALMFRKRNDFESPHAKPHDTGMVVLGTSLLWFGWFGFNAGSALAANGLAGHAFATTFFAAAAAMLSWMMVDIAIKGKPTAVGASVGAVAGLVAITPAAGFVTPMASIAIGLIAGSVCNYAATMIKTRFKLDDTLDVFGCHGLGGTLGTVLTGLFATKAVNSAGADGAFYGNPALLKTQLLSAVAVALFSAAGTYVIIKGVNLFTPVEATDEEEKLGLDPTQHGEWISSTHEWIHVSPNAREVLVRSEIHGEA